MRQTNRLLHLAALLLVLTAATAAAQQASPTKPDTISSNLDGTAKTSSASARVEQTWDQTWDQTKAMTRKEWRAARRKWAIEKVKWRGCNRRADAEKLTAPKNWTFIASCMTGS